MNDEHDEEECESVNERCINVNKTPQEHVTKFGPDTLLEKSLKRIVYKTPQKHETRFDPDNLLRKSLKRIVCGRLCHETSGGRPQGQSLEQKRPEVSELGHSPGPDIEVTGSWTSESWDFEPAGLDCDEGDQRELEAGEEELVESIERRSSSSPSTSTSTSSTASLSPNPRTT